jgi:3-phosphoshikimate 1-carboxyvinyltransferase
MALPDLIEIVPLDKPVKAEITVPGSKSITNRALILAALADGEVTLKGALWSEDTQIMVECLKELGFVVHVTQDPDELCNRTIKVVGQGGLIPTGGTETEPLDLFVGNAGTAARFLAPFLCLGSGVYRLHGVKRMHERPQAALFSALRELGYRVESENGNDKLPARISHRGTENTEEIKSDSVPSASLWQKKCKVSIEESSQFASALLLSAEVGGWEIEIVGENADESPYVAMTSKLMEVFPKNGGAFQIEPDASSGSYFWAANFLQTVERSKETLLLIQKVTRPNIWTTDVSSIEVSDWPKSDWQLDADFTVYFKPFSAAIPIEISRQNDLADSIMTAIVMAPFNSEGGRFVKFIKLGRLRVQECERVVALRTELTKCGAKVVEEGDTLTVWPSQLHGAEIETYNDHRMAMCFAILGLKVPGIKIKNPACVKKTFPNFFQKLAAQPPHGLGAEIWEIKNGQRARKLSGEDLFAD